MIPLRQKQYSLWMMMPICDMMKLCSVSGKFCFSLQIKVRNVLLDLIHLYTMHWCCLGKFPSPEKSFVYSPLFKFPEKKSFMSNSYQNSLLNYFGFLKIQFGEKICLKKMMIFRNFTDKNHKLLNGFMAKIAQIPGDTLLNFPLRWTF